MVSKLVSLGNTARKGMLMMQFIMAFSVLNSGSSFTANHNVAVGIIVASVLQMVRRLILSPPDIVLIFSSFNLSHSPISLINHNRTLSNFSISVFRFASFFCLMKTFLLNSIHTFIKYHAECFE